MPQVHAVLTEQLELRARFSRVLTRWLAAIVDRIEYQQRRGQQSRTSHDKATRRKLRAKGILLRNAKRCPPLPTG